MENKRFKKGISLIVLVITIIVIIILAAAVILTLTDNNPITNAKQAAFLNDLDSFKSELDMYKTSEYATKQGDYNPIVLEADEGSLTYNGEVYTSKNIYTAITSLKGIKKYEGQFSIEEGELVYLGKNKFYRDIVATNETVKLGDPLEPKVYIIPPSDSVFKSGTDVIYTIKIASKIPISTIDFTNKIELINNEGQQVDFLNSNILVGTLSGLVTDKERYINVTLKTSSLIENSYKLKVKAESIKDTSNNINSSDTVSLTSFDIDSTPPNSSEITVSTSDLTPGPVVVEINYPEDSVEKLYSLNGTTWFNYSTPINVTINNTTVYSKSKDIVGNESGQTTKTIANIGSPPNKVANFTMAFTYVQPTKTANISWSATTSWGSPNTNSNYKLEVQYNGTGDWVLVGNTGTTISKVDTISSLDTNTSIMYRVRAENIGGVSEWTYSTSMPVKSNYTYARYYCQYGAEAIWNTQNNNKDTSHYIAGYTQAPTWNGYKYVFNESTYKSVKTGPITLYEIVSVGMRN